MAGGPIWPWDEQVKDGDEDYCFPLRYPFDGGGAVMTLGVLATLTVADRVWRLQFCLPDSLPAGDLHLRLTALCDTGGAGGTAKVNAKWAFVKSTEDRSTITRQAEGTTTVTWSGSTNDDKDVVTDIELDADTYDGETELVVDLTFEVTGWSMPAISGWRAALVWK